MKIIKFIDVDGTRHTFNPLFVSNVKLTKSEYKNEWCLVVKLNENGTNSVFTRSFKDEESAYDSYEYVNSCLESINE